MYRHMPRPVQLWLVCRAAGMHADCIQVQALLHEQRKRAFELVEQYKSRVEALSQELISKQVRPLSHQAAVSWYATMVPPAFAQLQELNGVHAELLLGNPPPHKCGWLSQPVHHTCQPLSLATCC
jgi:hypothetical protein